MITYKKFENITSDDVVLRVTEKTLKKAIEFANSINKKNLISIEFFMDSAIYVIYRV